jgi:hypothetical protein
MSILLGSCHTPKTFSSFLEDLPYEFVKEHGMTIFFSDVPLPVLIEYLPYKYLQI